MLNSYIFNIEKYIYVALKKYTKRIIINSNISVSNVDRVMQKVIDDHADLFYINKWNSGIYSNRLIVEPFYIYTRKDIKRISEECEKQLCVILSRIDNMSELDQMKTLHDILIRNIEYYDCDDLYIYHTIIGPLLKRKSVCDGYSRLYKLLLDRINIPCIVVRGRGFNTSLLDSELHLWNMINYQGKWYHIDVTYDNALSLADYIRYDYFLVDESVISIDHYYDKNSSPKALDNSRNPYDKEPILKNAKDVIGLINKNILLNRKDFIVRIGSNCDDSEEFVNRCINEVINKNQINKIFEYYINESRGIVHIRIR